MYKFNYIYNNKCTKIGYYIYAKTFKYVYIDSIYVYEKHRNKYDITNIFNKLLLKYNKALLLKCQNKSNINSFMKFGFKILDDSYRKPNYLYYDLNRNKQLNNICDII